MRPDCTRCGHEKDEHNPFVGCEFELVLEEHDEVYQCPCRAFTTDPMPKQEELGL